MAESILDPTALARIGQLSQAEMDEIALDHGGVVGVLAPGQAPPTFSQRRHGYRPAWVDKNKSGRRDTLVLCGTGRRTHDLLNRGRARVLAAQEGVAYLTAHAVVTASKGIHGAQDPLIQQYVLRTSMWRAWAHFPSCDKHINRWFRYWAMPDEGLSAQQYRIAHRVVEQLARHDQASCR